MRIVEIQNQRFERGPKATEAQKRLDEEVWRRAYDRGGVEDDVLAFEFGFANGKGNRPVVSP